MYIGKENNKSYYNSPSKQTIGFTPSKSAQSIAAAWGTAASQVAPSFKTNDPLHSPKRIRTPSKPMNQKVQTPKKAKSPINARPVNSPQQNPNAIPFQFTLTPSKNSHISNPINAPSVTASPSQTAKLMRGQSKLSPLPSAVLSPLAWSPINRRSPFKDSASPLWSPNSNLQSSPSVVAHSVAPLNFTEELVCDEYGFFVDMNCDENSPTFKRTMHPPLATPSRSLDKQCWERYLADESPILDTKLVDNLILKGIHRECRANVWRKLLNVDAMKEYYRSEGIYYNYLRSSGSNAHTAQIKLDLKRTFPTHKLFQQKKGLDTLYNILAAYSHFNQSVGYCQGMAYVCGVLMMHFEEEDAFWTFVCMMKKVEKYYGSKMEGVLSDTNLLTSFMKVKMPQLFSHLQDHKIDTLLFSSKWLLSMFTDLPNWESVLRIWDIFFLEGRKGLLRVCLGILSNCEEELCEKTGIEQIMPFICNPPAHIVSPSTLFSKIHKINIDELYVQVQTPQCTPQSSGVFSFFNNMVSSIDTLLTPKTVDRTPRTRRQIYETPSKSYLISMTPSVARNIVASTPVQQNVTAFADFATPKYLREKVIDEHEELTPRKRQAVQDANDGVYPVKRLRF